MPCSTAEYLKQVNIPNFVIPAKEGIQRKKKDWIPHQVRNDRNKVTLQQATGDIKFNAFVLVLVGDNI